MIYSNLASLTYQEEHIVKKWYDKYYSCFIQFRKDFEKHKLTFDDLSACIIRMISIEYYYSEMKLRVKVV